MISILFSVRDELDQFGRIFSAPSEGFARRDFASAVNNGDSALSYAPADFGLYKVGTFDTSSGSVTPEPVPVLVCRGTEVVSHE